MKKYLVILGLALLPLTYGYAQDVWTSDEIKAPLRSEANKKSKIISMISAGQKVKVLANQKGYVKVRTANNKVGWLSNFYVLRKSSVHEQFDKIQSELTEKKEQLAKVSAELEEKKHLISQFGVDGKKAQAILSGSELLKNKLIEQNRRIAQLVKALDVEKQKTLDAKTQYVSLTKVSQNAVDIDKKNKQLQEQLVANEQTTRQLQAENQSLQSQISKRDFIVGVLTVLAGILVGYVLSIIMPPNGRRRSSSYHGSL